MELNKFENNVAKLMYQVRRSANISLLTVSLETGLSEDTICLIETAQINMTHELLKQLCALYGTDPALILDLAKTGTSLVSEPKLS